MYFIPLKGRRAHLQVHLSETDFLFYPKKFWWQAQLQAEQDRGVIAFKTERCAEKKVSNQCIAMHPKTLVIIKSAEKKTKKK